MSRLAGPVRVGGRTAPSRVLFGPHETNLARGRRLADRHVAYYRRRAEGGAGIVVTETASVHDSDWPYERAPLAALCGPGWSSVADACRPHGTLVVASLGHAGGQGSSAHHQSALWAPSRVPDAVSRELPMAMEEREISALLEGFRDSAALAEESGVDGVEIDAGQHSLLRQFCSGLTNQRTDRYGADRGLLLREVLAAVREVIGDRILGLRLACDEGAPWAGITPASVPEVDGVDYLVPVRGSAFADARPDLRTEPGFNSRMCRALSGRVLTVLQGSVVDPAEAERSLEFAGLVEMTRAQIADPDLVRHVRAGTRPRPCVLSNQRCRVRDPRNPIVSCIGEPRSGHETEDPPVGEPGSGEVLVVGGGPAGLEAARVLALRGFDVELTERAERVGGMVRVAARVTGRDRLAGLVDWLESEVRRLGVRVRTGVETTAADGRPVIVATGSVAGPRDYAVDGGRVLDVVDVLTGAVPVPGGPVVVHDPLGDWVGAGVAELLAARHPVAIVSPDPVIATQVADLAEVNARLQRAGVALAKRSRLREVCADHVVLEDVFTAERRALACAAVVHCGHRLPNAALAGQAVGDAVAPRTIHEAVLDGRRAAVAL
ncbi:mycofactocin system FadH/OYE family oxidoreductase 1 [Amycolatopsis thermophila]|uniref:Mycofactocin system FadH/OYE family oxidoreductase 1 n=1 Tax=Amycolatopsis thermophila TaxID=206084 RepID=A0ABU0EXL3_9PSEU|nr:mycofactocin system FadH/OYE family oxidoreductase 1 [Amycolatopsis thermophila]MDQ0380069.1 mycofactocin system FadH/OYE family oxidoreductase 1 [Amycolatopsis thermophila]